MNTAEKNEEVDFVVERKRIALILKSIINDQPEKETGEHYGEYKLRIVEYRNNTYTRGIRFKIGRISKGQLPGSPYKKVYKAHYSIGGREEFYFFQEENVRSIEIKQIYHYDRNKKIKNQPREKILELYFSS